MQRYIGHPLLLPGIHLHKFDLRVFVTVTSVLPLRVFVHRHGWANVADRPFAENSHLSHVTNAAFVEHADPAKVREITRVPAYRLRHPF